MSDVTVEEGNRRLLVLADFLEALDPSRFDYDLWVGDEWEGRADLSCGTTACAMGWATAIPEFRDAGLRMTFDPLWGYGGFCVSGEQHEVDGFTAGEHFFGLNQGQASQLFMAAVNEPTNDPKFVAQKIRSFVASR